MGDVTSYDAGASPSPRIVEPLADCASARAGGHLAPGADATTVPGAPFTKAELAAIRAMREAGLTWRQIAEKTGRPFYGLDKAARRHGLVGAGGRTWTPERETQLREMVAKGLKPGQIAEATGRTPKSVRNKMFELNLSWRAVVDKRPGVPWSDQDIETLRHMRAQGAFYSTIAKVLGRSEEAVQMSAKRLGIPAPEIKRLTCPVQRKKANLQAIRKPQPDKKTATAMRRCLCGCNKMFLSEGPGNRISPTCREVFAGRHTGAV